MPLLELLQALEVSPLFGVLAICNLSGHFKAPPELLQVCFGGVQFTVCKMFTTNFVLYITYYIFHIAYHIFYIAYDVLYNLHFNYCLSHFIYYSLHLLYYLRQNIEGTPG